jgi:hypothetical protein
VLNWGQKMPIPFEGVTSERPLAVPNCTAHWFSSEIMNFRLLFYEQRALFAMPLSKEQWEKLESCHLSFLS